jgi:hypothetical protein
MKKWKQFVMVLGIMVGIGTFTLSPAPAGAINVFPACGANADQAVCKSAKTDNATSMAKTVVNVMLFILGIIAVIMIVIGGIRYAVSAGDSSAVTGAKNTILYAVIGLVVAILAYAIVNFVLTAFK